MNSSKKILTFILTLILYSCADYNSKVSNQDKNKLYYSSNGFALIYDENFYQNKIINKKINNDEIMVMHNLLKRNTLVRIINPENSKTIETKIYKTANYPNIFTAVISNKIASILELDVNNPYIEIIELKKNKTFVAKEGSMFEEEKNVAEKAPVNEVKMDDLTKKESKVKKNEIKTNYILVIADFFYIGSANNLKDVLTKKTNFNNISIRKINNNKYRLFVGPFKNFNALKSSIISLNNLGFESLNIYRD